MEDMDVRASTFNPDAATKFVQYGQVLALIPHFIEWQIEVLKATDPIPQKWVDFLCEYDHILDPLGFQIAKLKTSSSSTTDDNMPDLCVFAVYDAALVTRITWNQQNDKWVCTVQTDQHVESKEVEFGSRDLEPWMSFGLRMRHMMKRVSIGEEWQFHTFWK